MTLKQFKDHIKSFSEHHVFNYRLSEPFSWRGDYSQVAFSINEGQTPQPEILKEIESAYKDVFYGYKGGEYTFADYTEVHFEEQPRDWSDGEYVSQLIATIEGTEAYKSIEEKLVKIAFK